MRLHRFFAHFRFLLASSFNRRPFNQPTFSNQRRPPGSFYQSYNAFQPKPVFGSNFNHDAGSLRHSSSSSYRPSFRPSPNKIEPKFTHNSLKDLPPAPHMLMKPIIYKPKENDNEENTSPPFISHPLTNKDSEQIVDPNKSSSSSFYQSCNTVQPKPAFGSNFNHDAGSLRHLSSSSYRPSFRPSSNRIEPKFTQNSLKDLPPAPHMLMKPIIYKPKDNDNEQNTSPPSASHPLTNKNAKKVVNLDKSSSSSWSDESEKDQPTYLDTGNLVIHTSYMNPFPEDYDGVTVVKREPPKVLHSRKTPKHTQSRPDLIPTRASIGELKLISRIKKICPSQLMVKTTQPAPVLATSFSVPPDYDPNVPPPLIEWSSRPSSPIQTHNDTNIYDVPFTSTNPFLQDTFGVPLVEEFVPTAVADSFILQIGSFGYQAGAFSIPQPRVREIKMAYIIEVYIVACNSPSQFDFSFNLGELRTLTEEMKWVRFVIWVPEVNFLFYFSNHYNFFGVELFVPDPCEGMAVAALYEGAWHRAEILKVFAWKAYVNLVDRELRTRIELDDLRYLEKSFAAPSRKCCKGSLHGVKAKSENSLWSTDAIMSFMELTKDVRLYAHAKAQNENVFELSLMSTSNKARIADVLVRNGFADEVSSEAGNILLVST